MSTHTPDKPSPEGPTAPPQTDKSKAQARSTAQNQAAQGDHGKKPETDNKSGKPS